MKTDIAINKEHYETSSARLLERYRLLHNMGCDANLHAPIKDSTSNTNRDPSNYLVVHHFAGFVAC